MSLSYINYKGKKVLYVDYRQCKTTQEMLNVLEESKKLYESCSDSFLTINDFTGTTGSSEFMQKVKQYGKSTFDGRTTKSAILGISGIKKILLNGYNSLVKRKIVPFDTKEEALEYLVS